MLLVYLDASNLNNVTDNAPDALLFKTMNEIFLQISNQQSVLIQH